MEARLEELRKDELWKSVNCRHCPACSRVVERISGCDNMVCNQNYGNAATQQGAGCGQWFYWPSALRYTPHMKGGPKLPEPPRVEPSSAHRRHVVPGTGEPRLCNVCMHPIVGLRFEQASGRGRCVVQPGPQSPSVLPLPRPPWSQVRMHPLPVRGVPGLRAKAQDGPRIEDPPLAECVGPSG